MFSPNWSTARDGIPNVGGAIRPSKIPTPHLGTWAQTRVQARFVGE
jgi:hypothetical protein